VNELNPSQKAAVEHSLGPLLVLAGAGSGKTRVVTQRVARLIERGAPARSILAMTFTNKAAGEMHERVCKIVGAKIARELKVCTFHRFGLDVLGAETRALGLRGTSFAIFDQADCAGVVREILREVRTGRTYDVQGILARISYAKNAFIEPEEWENAEMGGKGADPYDEIAMLVYPRYISALKALQAFDFDDLICEVVRLWRRREDVLDRWRKRFRFVIVDEYQDTNHAQLELVRLLCGEHKNVCVVGDDDQSIYAWRGADVRNILDFEQHFAGAKVVKLQDNYRSTEAILNVANAVLTRAAGMRRHQKQLVAARKGGDKVQVVVAADPDVEASFVGSEIQRILEQEGARPRDVAVLYRSNQQSQLIESTLKERQIPMRMIGGAQFYERKEVKDLCAYLRFTLNPDDEVSLRRIINYPARGIGDVALSKLANHATAHDLSLWSVVSRPHIVRELPAAAMEGCRELGRIVEGTRARFERGEPSAEIARAVVAEIGLGQDILDASVGPTAARRLGNVEGLIQLFARRDAMGKGDRASFAEFLRLISLREESTEEEATDRVTLTTMHGAKGLEFRYVFVIGLEDGLMPHSRSLEERATDITPIAGHEGDVAGHSIDEERRLFYVAVTRARDRLYLCRAKYRGARGKMVLRTPSRFLQDIPPELVEERQELSPVAPEINQMKVGAASVLAALSFGGPEAGAPPIVRRPQNGRR
jgi:ATP-dependent DNA helicase Rep